jgi:predicted Zn-dependent peptidase
MFKYEKKTLKNGLRVIVVPMENTEAVTLLALVGVGSRHETKELNGISHFLEHMFFKGTKKRPKVGQMKEEINKMGAASNAYTGKERTGFWIKSAGSDFDKSLDIISDILQNPLFDKKELEKERGVILQEIHMREDQNEAKAYFELQRLVYDGHPLSRKILGDKKVIFKVKRGDFVKYRKENYVSENMVVVVAGNVNTIDALQKTEKVFSKIARGKKKKTSKFKSAQRSPRIKIVDKKVGQTYLAMATGGYGIFDKRTPAFEVLSLIIGGNTSSRIYHAIRSKMGLSYFIASFANQNVDSGCLEIEAGLSSVDLDKALTKIMKILRNVKEKGVTLAELRNAKSFLRGRMALSFETSRAIASFMGENELFYGKVIQPEEELKKIEKVTQSDILKVARDIFKPSKMNMAVIGQHEDTKENREKYKKILEEV